MRKIIITTLTLTALTAGAATASAETVSVSDGTVVTEGAAGDHVKATFIVTRQRKLGEAEQGGYGLTTSDGTAAAGTDYFDTAAGTGFAPNLFCKSADGCVDSEQVTVEIIGDNVPEPEEHFFVNINSTTMRVDDAQGEGTIIDDDGFVAPKPKPAPAPAPTPAPISTPAPAPTPAPTHAGGPATFPTLSTQHPGVAKPPVTPAAADEVGPRVGMIFRGLRGHDARVRVSCPRDEAACVGRLAIRLNESTLASKAFRLKGGRSTLLRIRLSRSARRSLRSAGVVYLKASAFDAAGNRLVRELSFQL